MSAIHTIWEATLHAVRQWDELTLLGKRYIECKAQIQDIEECLHQMAELIVKLQWFKHNSQILYGNKEDVTVWYVIKQLDTIINMLQKEFDLKTCISLQLSQSHERRKLIAYTWLLQPYLNEAYIESLPKQLKQTTIQLD